MRPAGRAVAAAVLCAACAAGARVVSDMSGRKVSIPDRVERVVPLSNDLVVYIYTLNRGKLLGWNRAPAERARRFLDPATLSLPELRTLSGKGMNEEAVLALRPDLLVASDEDAVVDADAVQKRLGIPVVKISTELSRTAEAYELLGECLGDRDRAAKLAAWARSELAEIARTVSAIPASRRPRVYYAEGPEGLQTEVPGSTHTHVLDVLGARNVATLAGNPLQGTATVSFEQVLAWNPQAIVVGPMRGADARARILGDPRWRRIAAVRDGKVWRSPTLPFNWFDRPPSPARLLGLRWLGALLYPRELGTDLPRATRGFYKLFYGRKLTDAEVREILSQD